MSNVIQVHNLVKSFKDGNSKTVAINDVSFDLSEGEYYISVDTEGYKFPSREESQNKVIETSTGQKFIIVKSTKAKKIDLSIQVDRI